MLGEAHWLKLPTLARPHSNICMSCFTTGGPGKEHRTNKPPPIGRVQERSKGDTTCPTTSQNPHWHSSCLNEVCTTRKGSESEWLDKDNPEINSITIKPRLQPCGRAVLPSSFTLLLSWHPFPINLLLCLHMCLLVQFISECKTRAQFRALEAIPFPATLWPDSLI